MKKQTLLGLVGSILGVAFLFGSLILMEGLEKDRNKKKTTQKTNFQVKQQKKKKKKLAKKSRPKPKKKSRPKVAPPRLAGSLTGSSFGLDQFEFLSEAGEGLLSNNKNIVMTEDTVDVAPKAKYRPPLEYPSYARSRSIEGYVLLNMLIGTNGEVEQVKLLGSEPQGVFDQIAMSGARDWLFESAQYEGKNVKVWVQQRISFNLN
jgi:protein TonB